jgi:hypothetical protein
MTEAEITRLYILVTQQMINLDTKLDTRYKSSEMRIDTILVLSREIYKNMMKLLKQFKKYVLTPQNRDPVRIKFWCDKFKTMETSISTFVCARLSNGFLSTLENHEDPYVEQNVPLFLEQQFTPEVQHGYKKATELYQIVESAIINANKLMAQGVPW